MQEVLEACSTGRLLAYEVRYALTFRDRSEGLLGGQPLAPGQALVLSPAKQIHTFGMTYPIDVVFCGRNWEIRHVRRSMPPRRISRLVWRSHTVIELPAGSLPPGLERGHRLAIVSRAGGDRPD